MSESGANASATGALVARGVFLDRIESIEVCFMDGRLDADSFDLYLNSLGAYIDARERDHRVGVFYEVSSSPTLIDMERSKRIAKVMADRRDHLRDTVYAFVLVTQSKFIRGSLKAVFWLAPPPFPNAVEETVEDAFEFLSRYIPAMDPQRSLREYRELRARYEPLLG